MHISSADDEENKFLDRLASYRKSNFLSFVSLGTNRRGCRKIEEIVLFHRNRVIKNLEPENDGNLF